MRTKEKLIFFLVLFFCCLEIVYSVEEMMMVANTGLSLCKWGETLTFFRIFNFVRQCEIQLLK